MTLDFCCGLIHHALRLVNADDASRRANLLACRKENRTPSATHIKHVRSRAQSPQIDETIPKTGPDPGSDAIIRRRGSVKDAGDPFLVL